MSHGSASITARRRCRFDASGTSFSATTTPRGKSSLSSGIVPHDRVRTCAAEPPAIIARFDTAFVISGWDTEAWCSANDTHSGSPFDGSHRLVICGASSPETFATARSSVCSDNCAGRLPAIAARTSSWYSRSVRPEQLRATSRGCAALSMSSTLTGCAWLRSVGGLRNRQNTADAEPSGIAGRAASPWCTWSTNARA